MAKLSWRDAVEKVLVESGKAMHVREIVDAIASQGLREKLGATPGATVNSTVHYAIKQEGAACPFVRVARGYIALRSGAGGTSVDGASVGERPEDEDETGLINAFGVYWRRDKVLWRSEPRLLGQQQPGSTPVDFSGQRGVYLLYDGREAVYVGRTTRQPLGVRLFQHTIDRLNGRWDRFSWFGVFPVTERGVLADDVPEAFSIDILITTMEALLIEGLEPVQNRKRGDDFQAVEYLQVEDPEIQKTQFVDLMERLKKAL